MEARNNFSSRRTVAFLDCLLIAALLCVSAAMLLFRSSADDESLLVVVRKNSDEIYSCELSDAAAEKEICVDEEFHVVLCVMSDGVFVKSSDCEDKTCVNTGKITRSGQNIVCLPAHIVVELKGENDDFDAVVG